MNLSPEEYKILHLLAKRRNPDYYFTFDGQFISSLVFLKRNTSPCLICNKEINRDWVIIQNHGIFHLKEYKLIALI